MASRDHVSARVILEPARTVPSSANLTLPQSSAARLKMRSKLSETYAYLNPLRKWLFLGHLVENIAGRVSLPAFNRILPDIINDDCLPNFDNLSAV